MTSEIEARLASFDIRRMAQSEAFSVFVREPCIAMALRTEAGGFSLGSAGLMTENGLAYLLFRGDRTLLVAKGFETVAAPEQLEAIRRFSEDLKSALQL